MVNRTNQIIGQLGEKVARKYLTSRGYTIIVTNFPTPFGEIDLVARQNGWTIFFEVKTRTSDRFGSPLLGITMSKRKTILKNSLYYLKMKSLNDALCRIDIVAINLNKDGNLKMLEHVKNAIELH